MLTYLTYLLIRKTKYSIHSPFVFGFITQGLEKKLTPVEVKALKSDGVLSRKTRLLYKILCYFKVRSVNVIQQKDNVCDPAFSKVEINPLKITSLDSCKPVDCDVFYLTFEVSDKFVELYDKIKKRSHNNTMIIFEAIHQTETSKKHWKNIILDKKITVSIDLFNIGIVFFKTELSKQHFIL